MDNHLYDAVVIGGGPAGLTAALYLARACYRVIVVEKEKFGGQITITSEVVNYPGVKRASGDELTRDMQRQAESFGAEFLLAEVTGLDLSGDVKKVVTSRGTLECFGVILATGAHPRMIGFPGEADFRGHGVAYCATCDGEFFTGKDVFVVGGGFAAAEESVFLTKYARSVTVLVREGDFTCAAATADGAKNHPKVKVLYNTEVVKVEGDSLLRKIVYRNAKTGETTSFSPQDGGNFGVFVFAGYEPETALVKGICELDPHGYVVTDRSQKTSVDGVYAAGDVCIKPLRQVVTAVGDGALAATEVEKWAAAMQKKTGMKPNAKVHTAAVHRPVDSSPGPVGKASSGPIDADMLAQLQTVFQRMQNPLLLSLALDSRPVSSELKSYMETLAGATDKLSVRVEDASGVSAEELPRARVCRPDGSWTGLAFHGVPGGHEFTSFVLGLYNAAGPGQPIDPALKARVEAISSPVDMKIMVSLSCTMCPDLVVAAQRMASLNANVTVDVYDLNHFPAMKDRYQVMSVPCFVINGGAPHFGKKDISALLELI
ncbi:MAG: FAD-dependent oxidoreductase [Kiritimatiellae bacterium]|nr:FAD-dependent oxidoreductase [Kiritimatiellia bacterium]